MKNVLISLGFSVTWVPSVRADFNVEVAPGQSELKGKIFRIGHLGYVEALDIIGAWAAVEVLFKRLGAKINFGAGVKAAMELL